MKFTDACEARINFPEADFWLVRSGAEIGKSTKTFDPNHIGIKVTATDVLLPDYLFYLMEYVRSQGAYRGIAKLNPQHLHKITFQPTGRTVSLTASFTFYRKG